MEKVKWSLLILTAMFIVVTTYIKTIERRMILEKLEILTTRQTEILTQLLCPPELKRIYYDPACDDPEKKRNHIPINEKLIPKKKIVVD